MKYNNEYWNLSSITQGSSSLRLWNNNSNIGSVATFDYDIFSPEFDDLSFDFLGTANDTKVFLTNQRWNEVAMYSILFFSIILNVYLLLKVIRNRQNFTNSTKDYSLLN